MSTPLKIVIVGCGNVSARYAEQTLEHVADLVEIVGYSDIDAERAVAFAEKYGGQAYASLDAVLADDAVELIVNLTIHHAHYDVIKQCLNAGKHVYTEKPITLEYAQAKELVDLAEAKGKVLAGAPITFMGDAQQTAWKQVRDGVTGTVRLIYAENNHGRIESWHPNPGPFYAVGPLWDTGVYPLTLATTFFGPAKRIATAYARVIYPDRVTKEGVEFSIETPEFITAVIELASGPVVRLTSNFYAKNSEQAGKFEIHGDAGTVTIGNFQASQAPVTAGAFGEEMKEVPHLQEPVKGIPFYRGIQEVAEALRDNRQCRVTGAHAAHVVEILEAISKSAETHEPVDLTSTFPQPEPMDWAK